MEKLDSFKAQKSESFERQIKIDDHIFSVTLNPAESHNPALHIYNLSFAEEKYSMAILNLSVAQRIQLFNEIFDYLKQVVPRTKIDAIRFIGSSFALDSSEAQTFYQMKRELEDNTIKNQKYLDGFLCTREGITIHIEDGVLQISDKEIDAEYSIEELFHKDKMRKVLPEWFEEEILKYKFNDRENSDILSKNYDEELKDKKSKQRMLMYKRFLSKSLEIEYPEIEYEEDSFGDLVIYVNKHKKEEARKELII